MMEARGIRNNNPLNIRKSGDKWQGLRTLQEDREFFQFAEMKWGWRAAFVILCRTYYKKYGLKTISDIIYRWAPPKENNTAAYIRRVSDYISIGPDRDLGDPQTHPTQWMMLGIAMAVVECGTASQDYLSMLKGFSLAMGE
ncbi:MAG: hypothetical protein J5524_01085 [Bacteroidaceae bacterium]|nr:hypothetical protein [Bacteroidaceae bacterium]